MKQNPADHDQPTGSRLSARWTADNNARHDRDADEDFEQGRGIALKDAVAWVRSWFTARELPKPAEEARISPSAWTSAAFAPAGHVLQDDSLMATGERRIGEGNTEHWA